MGSIARMVPKPSQVVATCPSHQLQPIAQNSVFKNMHVLVGIRIVSVSESLCCFLRKRIHVHDLEQLWAAGETVSENSTVYIEFQGF